jgi:predicted MFS family arabinose efflux permease
VSRRRNNLILYGAFCDLSKAPLASEPSAAVRVLPEESRAIAILSLVVTFRMIGLFMILPVLAMYTAGFDGGTPLVIGLVVGAYGITQALLQIPMGLLSDRIGRKPVIIGGLFVLAAGSALAASAETLPVLLAGRVLQGAGAISSAATALLADLTRFEVRTRAMAILGASIGASFMVSLALGPLVGAWIGADGIFWFTAMLAVGGAALVAVLVPSPPARTRPLLNRRQLFEVLASPPLLRLDAGVFLVHLQLTAVFVALPLLLRDQIGLAADLHWRVYMTGLVLSLFVVIPMIRSLERGAKALRLWRFALVMLAIGEIALAVLHANAVLATLGLAVFFAGFNFVEARLPAEVTRAAPGDRRGAATGVYASSQFFGAFVGGTLGGALFEWGGAEAVFGFTALSTLVWLGLLRVDEPADV